MEFYRYLFAPILVAVAIWTGHRERPPARAPKAPAAAVAPAVLVTPAPPRPAANRPEASRPGAGQGTVPVRPAR
jgi:hypothetical protein